MENSISFKVSKNSTRYVCMGEVIEPIYYEDLDEISVTVYSELHRNVLVDSEYSSPLFKKIVGDLICRFVDLSDSSSSERFKKYSKELEFVYDSLSLFYPNSSAMVIEHSVIHIGEDIGTLNMLSNLKTILSSASCSLGFKEDIIVWWYLDDVEWKFVMQNKNVFTDRVDFLESCRVIIIH